MCVCVCVCVCVCARVRVRVRIAIFCMSACVLHQCACLCFQCALNSSFRPSHLLHYCIRSIIDSSEMVDTYGARLDEVRSFVKEGWTACSTNTGE